MKTEKVSELTTNRLSVYLRCLNELSAGGFRTVSSEKLATMFHLNSAQIRKDLANFGEFGVRGVGYSVDALRDHLRKILGLNKVRRVAIVGTGKLGSALADYYRLSGSNFVVSALFDTDPAKIGGKIGDVEVYDAKSFAEIVKRDKIEVAVITVPPSAAQSVLDHVTDAGLKAVMNFAPVPLKAASGVKVKTVDLTTSLESLSYYLAAPPGGNGKQLKPIGENGRK